MIQIAFFLMTKSLAIADEKLKITRVWLVDGWIVDFVQDAMAEREPKTAARVVGGAETVFCAGGPSGLETGRAEGG